MMSLGADFDMSFHAKVSCDASAAIGMVNRTGAGKLRHIRVQYLWIQDVVRSGQIQVAKVPGTENPADLLTKSVDAHTMSNHCWRLGCEVLKDRATTAPTLNAMLAMVGFCDKSEEEEKTGAGEEEVTEELKKDRDEDSRRGPGQMDTWKQVGVWMVRAHHRPRRELFTPLRVSGSPPAKALATARITQGTFNDGEAFRIVDSWTSRSQAHRALDRPWIGSTRFVLKKAEEACETET